MYKMTLYKISAYSVSIYIFLELHGCLVIYISTDYVFDGSKPPYDITDQPNPLNGYGKTKFAGENVVMKYNKSKC